MSVFLSFWVNLFIIHLVYCRIYSLINLISLKNTIFFFFTVSGMMRQSWAFSFIGGCSQCPVSAQSGSGGTGRVPKTRTSSATCRQTISQTSPMQTLHHSSLQSSSILLDGLTSLMHLVLGQHCQKYFNNGEGSTKRLVDKRKHLQQTSKQKTCKNKIHKRTDQQANKNLNRQANFSRISGESIRIRPKK